MFRPLLCSVALVLVLTGCVITPEPLDQQDLHTFATDKVDRVTQDQEALNRAVDLYEAMARALKYNLDYKVELKERSLRIKRLDLATYKLLPDLVVNSGYAGRNKYAGGNSREILSSRTLGTESLTFSSSQDLDIFTSDIALSWHILDFGLSYVRAKQQADEVLVAEELKRKVVNRVIEDVRTSYWRAVSGQRLLRKLRRLESRVRRALADTRKLSSGGQTSPITALTYERELVEIKREIQKLEGELRIAKTQLAALMNVRPGKRFRVSEAGRRTVRLKVKLSPRQMIAIAMINRPELREVAYKQRINEKEADAALLELLPGIQVYAGPNWSSNSFLFSNDWLSYGAKASWNLMRIFQYPARLNVIEGQDDLLDQRALALTMAIMTQIHVANVRYHHYRKELATAGEFLSVQRRLLKQIRSGASAGRVSEQTLIREEMNTLVAEVKFDIAHATLQNAFANVFASMGLDPYEGSFATDESVASIAGKLRRVWFERGDFGAGLKLVRK